MTSDWRRSSLAGQCSKVRPTGPRRAERIGPPVGEPIFQRVRICCINACRVRQSAPLAGRPKCCIGWRGLPFQSQIEQGGPQRLAVGVERQ